MIILRRSAETIVDLGGLAGFCNIIILFESLILPAESSHEAQMIHWR